MSGPLRRIKRSRPAEAGEPHTEGRAAEPEGATPTPQTPPATPEQVPASPSEPATQVEAPGPETSDEPAVAPKQRRRLFRRRAKEAPATPQPAPPVLVADPSVPAGVDPAEAPMRPPAGRRGRLRRRLRYLRRARELMLRDLGGLLYEVHRTGGGDVEAHATVVGAKVQRIAGLDAEARALETALAAPRGEAVVFEPGVGGTCAACGELYGSDARFCSNCGTAIGAAVAPSPATRTPDVEPAKRAFWRRAAKPAAPAPADGPAGGESAAAPTDDTAVMNRTDEPGAGREESAATGDERAREAPAADAPAGSAPVAEPRAHDAQTAEPPAADARPDEQAAERPDTRPDEQAAERPDTRPDEQTAGDEPRGPGTDAASTPDGEPRNPYSGLGNGRPEDRKSPGLSSGDPLVSRERS
jgi:hypothetical protein